MPIHDNLLIALSDIARRMSEDIRSLLKRIESAPIELEARELRPDAPLLSVAAADSSYQIKGYSMAFVYAVQASAISVSPRDGSSSSLVDADAGYLIVSPEVESRLRAGGARAMSLDSVVKRMVKTIAMWLEASLLGRASRGADVALFDGSLFSFLWHIWHSERVPDLPAVSYKEVSDSEWPSARGGLRREELWRRTVEKILEIRRSGAIPVFIAKSIRRNYYAEGILAALLGPERGERVIAGSAINDIVLINLLRYAGRLPRKPFALGPIYVESPGQLPRPLARLYEKEGLLRSVLPITVTYAAFGPTSQPYQVTTLGKLSPEELVSLLSSIYAYSQAGYPEPLRIVHGMCKIGSRELRSLLLKLGFSQLPTGREPLGEM